MNEVLLVSFIGSKQQGRLKNMAECTHKLGGKWLNSKVSYLDSEVAAIIKIQIPINASAELKKIFTSHQDLLVKISEVQDYLSSSISEVKFTIEAEDRSGIINDITRVLESLEVGILNLDSRRLGVADFGSSLFIAKITVAMPDSMEKAELIEAIENQMEDVLVKE